MRILNPKTVIQFLSLEKEDKAGYLWKRRLEHKGSFKKRYFTVCGNILAYFEKKLDRDPLGILILEGHVVEMLDDLTMALRFPSLGESCRSYVLRGETAADTEQWMRVLSRSGIDFLTLTLEDLEDQLSALTAVRRSSKIESPPPVPSIQHGVTAGSAPKLESGRSNPFNRHSGLPQSVSPSRARRRAPSPPSASKPDKPSSELVVPSSQISPHPSTRHLNWLLAQTWEQLHSLAREHLRTSTVAQEQTTQQSNLG